jgi:hypothetical protein
MACINKKLKISVFKGNYNDVPYYVFTKLEMPVVRIFTATVFL